MNIETLRGLRTFIAVILAILVTGILAGMVIVTTPAQLLMSNILGLGGMLTSVFSVVIGGQAYKSIQSGKQGKVK